MTAHTRDQLIQMARQVVDAFDRADPRYIELIARVAERTGMRHSDVARAIHSLAAERHPLDPQRAGCPL